MELQRRSGIVQAKRRQSDNGADHDESQTGDHSCGAARRQRRKNCRSEALGAAAKAATDVVLERTAAALASGKAKLTQATPAIRRAAGKAAKRSVDRPTRRKKPTRARRSTARRKRAATVVARKRKKTRARS